MRAGVPTKPRRRARGRLLRDDTMALLVGLAFGALVGAVVMFFAVG